MSDEKPIQVPPNSPPPQQVPTPKVSPRRPSTRRGKSAVREAPSSARKTVRASRQTTRSRAAPQAGDTDAQAVLAPTEQKTDAAANAAGSRRRARPAKEEAPEQRPEPVKPLRTSRRALRAPQDTSGPAASQGKSSVPLSPEKKPARDGRAPRPRGPCVAAPGQEVAEEKPVPRKQRTVLKESPESLEPPKMKCLKIMTERIELETPPCPGVKTRERKPKAEEPLAPDQRIPLRSRRQQKTSAEEQKPGPATVAEKVPVKGNRKKAEEPSPEAEPENPVGGAKKSTSQGNASRKRPCLRARGQSAEGEENASSEIPSRGQKEKAVAVNPEVKGLRSRKTETQPSDRAAGPEPQPRATRGAKRIGRAHV